jgi:hypothetical protein
MAEQRLAETRLRAMNDTLLMAGQDWSDVLLDAAIELERLRRAEGHALSVVKAQEWKADKSRAELELHKGALIAEQEHVETLEADLAECREDAERYRWLRDNNPPEEVASDDDWWTDYKEVSFTWQFREWVAGKPVVITPTLDAAIDAARKGKGE